MKYTIDKECAVFHLSCGGDDVVYTYKIFDEAGDEAASAVSYKSQVHAAARAAAISIALNVGGDV